MAPAAMRSGHHARARQQALRRASSRSTRRTSTIGRGEFFSMLGPSGCGKTTTLRMIAGFEQPTSGRDPARRAATSRRVPPYKRNVNTVFQHYALFPHMTRARQRRLRAAQQAAARGRGRRSGWASCSRSCGSPASPSARPAQLSGGQQQRVALARALVNYPERAAARRAARRPRPQAAPGDADRAQAHPARGRHHLHLRDPRPGRGADDVGPDRGDERGAGRADRHAARRSTTRRRPCFVASFIGVANLLPASVVAAATAARRCTVCWRAPAAGPGRRPGSRRAVGGRRRWSCGPSGCSSPPRSRRLGRRAAGDARRARCSRAPVVRCAFALATAPRSSATSTTTTTPGRPRRRHRAGVSWDADAGRRCRRRPRKRAAVERDPRGPTDRTGRAPTRRAPTTQPEERR